MSVSEKYGRTYHFPFSPGTTSDDRISHNYWEDTQKIKQLVHTEKLDGENNCLSQYGVFARSHVSPTTSNWTQDIRQFWHLVKNQLGDLEIFLENTYATHSIEYRNLDSHYFVFGVREHGQWLSWEETKFYAAMLDLPTVPEIKIFETPSDKNLFEKETLEIVSHRGPFHPYDLDGKPCTMEGIVTRNTGSYSVEDFAKNVFKYVRKGHVKTSQHWSKEWKRAKLFSERHF